MADIVTVLNGVVQCIMIPCRPRRQVGKAIADYGMIDDGDRVMVCVSGGKDSYTPLDMLLALQRRAPVDFELVAVNLDQKQPGFPEEVLPQYLEALGVDYRIVEEDTYSVVTRVVPAGKTLCGSQENLRRKQIKAMLAAWETEDPGRTERLFRSLRNVTLPHLADPDRYDFRSITSISN